jgi:hypothetical protein
VGCESTDTQKAKREARGTVDRIFGAMLLRKEAVSTMSVRRCSGRRLQRWRTEGGRGVEGGAEALRDVHVVSSQEEACVKKERASCENGRQ